MTSQNSYPNVRMWRREDTRPAYIFKWNCSRCDEENQKEIEDAADLSPLPVGCPVDLDLWCDECYSLDKVRIQIDVTLHTSPTTTRKEE